MFASYAWSVTRISPRFRRKLRASCLRRFTICVRRCFRTAPYAIKKFTAATWIGTCSNEGADSHVGGVADPGAAPRDTASYGPRTGYNHHTRYTPHAGAGHSANANYNGCANYDPVTCSVHHQQ
jgi:hypothetical protein